jgi:hypothetical protein
MNGLNAGIMLQDVKMNGILMIIGLNAGIGF